MLPIGTDAYCIQARFGFNKKRKNYENDWIDAETPTWEASNAWFNAFGNALPQNGPENRKGFTYSFSHNNAFFAGLEQYAAADYTYDPDNPDLDWLSEQLDSNTREHVFVFGHAPAFQAVTHECLMRHPDNMSRFWELLHDAGARVYFCAHEHFYGRARACIDNAFTPRQVIIGTGGGPIATEWDGSYLGDGQYGARIVSEAWNADPDRYGYLLVEVDGSEVSALQTRRVNGLEMLRYAGYHFRALWTPGGFGGYAADLALYGADAWYAMTLDGSVTMWNEQWGAAGMAPVPGDYAGDGIADLAVYYEPDGLWFVYSLRKGVLAWHRRWGAPGLMPVMAR